MRRILLVLSIAALMAAMIVASAMPAFAENVKHFDGGPPLLSGNSRATIVEHCNAVEGGKSVTAFTKSGVHGNCDISPPE
jgi:CheY-specific phosphatase CheX